MSQAVAIVFPGQGSQSVGMLAEVAKAYPMILQYFSDASDVLGYDLWSLVQTGPEEKLNSTEYTQPALLVASYALWRALQSKHQFEPAFLAGHSLGEYSALLCADALGFADAVRLVAARGRFMQQAVEHINGAMAAIIGLSNEDVDALCQEVKEGDEVLAPANYNSIGQVVISGHLEAVNRAVKLAKAHGARMAVVLPVSVPSHCQLMLPAVEQLNEVLADVEIKTPLYPVVNNVDVNAYTDGDAIKDALLRQLSMPVRWVDTVQFFISQQVSQVIECGPGNVLTGLNKRIDKRLQLKSASDLLLS